MGRPRQESEEPAAEGRTEHTGVYWYRLAAGELRFRCFWVDSNRQLKWKRGFSSPRAAAEHRAIMIAASASGERSNARNTFVGSYRRWLRSKRSVTEGTRAGYEDAFVKRLEPAFGHLALQQLTAATIDEQVTEWVRSGEWAPKTINNTIGALSSFMSDMVRRGALAQNSVQFVERVPED